MAAYCRDYDSCRLQANCQELGSAPELYAQQSSMGYLLPNCPTCHLYCLHVTWLCVLGLGTLFDQIWILDSLADYSEPKQIFGTALISSLAAAGLSLPLIVLWTAVDTFFVVVNARWLFIGDWVVVQNTPLFIDVVMHYVVISMTCCSPCDMTVSLEH